MDLMLNQWTATNKIFCPDSQIVAHYLGTFKSRIVIKLIVDFNCIKNSMFHENESRNNSIIYYKKYSNENI
jgi:hypothetical protein